MVLRSGAASDSQTFRDCIAGSSAQQEQDCARKKLEQAAYLGPIVRVHAHAARHANRPPAVAKRIRARELCADGFHFGLGLPQTSAGLQSPEQKQPARTLVFQEAG